MNPAQEKKFNQLCERTERMERALMGDEGMEIKGIAFFTFDNRRRVARLERILWIGSGVVATVTAVYTFVKDWFPRLHP
ncbi:MAG: hypothetical protein B9S32_13830 [Verrucomicrobia bacterium Tous-C9LFEB]|nr:MAG: hypothetical protein B9S32_13830 [Verrucomicrobia bacterium Tous-C9LFEB]